MVRIFVIFLLLCACAPTDPAAMIAAGNAGLQAQTQAAHQATADQSARLAERTAHAVETVQAAGAVDTQLAVTRQVQMIRVTDDAAQATSYMRTLDARAALTNLEQHTQLQATQAARESQAADNGLFLRTAAFGLVLLFGYLFVTMGAYAAYTRITAVRLEARWRYSIPDSRLALPAMVDVPPADEVVTMIEKAIRVNGPTSNLIPRYDKLGMSASARQRIVGKLEAAGFVVTERDKWTMIRGEYGSLAHLLDALKTGRAGTI